LAIELVSVEASLDPTLLGDGVRCRRVSYGQWMHGAARSAEVIVWNNNLVLPRGACENAPTARLLVNWGTGDTNIECRQEWSETRMVTTGGYCTGPVRVFVLGAIDRLDLIGPSSVVGIIGMGRIGYALTRSLESQVDRLVYHSRHPRIGLDHEWLPLNRLLATTDLIIVAANTREPLDLTGLGDNQRWPFIITVSPDSAIPVASVVGLRAEARVRGILSDNPRPQGRRDLGPFYTGKVAYLCERARKHKHRILAKELHTVRRDPGHQDPVIYIARHGQTEWNETGRRQGRLDSPLTTRGAAQAQALARLARDRGVTRVYSSPLPRAVHTAKVVASKLKTGFEVVDSFIEMDFGGLQGELLSAEDRFPVFTRARQLDRLYTSYPIGGESYFDLSLRVQADVDRIAASGHTSLIVGHSSVNRMMLPFLVDGLLLDEAATIRQPSDLVIGVNLATRAAEHFTLEGK
jgi:broad specificity phosphatase PhoE